MEKALFSTLLALLLQAAATLALADDPNFAVVSESGAWLDFDSANPSHAATCDGCKGGICELHHETPFIRLAVDAVWLARSGVDSQDILFDGGGSPILNATELDLGVEAGPQLDVVLFHELGYDVGMRYFGIQEYRVMAERTAPGATFLFFGSSLLAPIDTYTVEYRSKLFNGELNGRWRASDRFTLLAGARTTDLQEVFNILTGPTSGVFSTADNDLYGVQIGGEGILWTNGYVRLEGSVKAGVFNNSVDIYAEASDAGGAPLTLNANADKTAFLGELTAGFVIPIWPGELRIGYQGLWLQNVILAPDQSDSLSFFAPGTVDFGEVMYHGGYAGWQATW